MLCKIAFRRGETHFDGKYPVALNEISTEPLVMLQQFFVTEGVYQGKPIHASQESLTIILLAALAVWNKPCSVRSMFGGALDTFYHAVGAAVVVGNVVNDEST